METTFVHSCIRSQHPEIRDQDVIAAWNGSIARARRERTDRNLYVAVGFDANGRLIEMVAVEKNGGFLIYHALTPPMKKTLRELDLLGR
jgi:hypothetical protein